MDYELTQHAENAVIRRKIRTEWLERALAAPERIVVDPVDDTLEHRLVIIPEYGDRVLRVVVNRITEPRRIVTLFFDRNMKGKL